MQTTVKAIEINDRDAYVIETVIDQNPGQSFSFYFIEVLTILKDISPMHSAYIGFLIGIRDDRKQSHKSNLLTLWQRPN